MENARGMRVESHGQRLGAQLVGTAHDLAKHVLMGPMYAVEIADCEHSAAEVGGKIFEMAVDLQSVLGSRFSVLSSLACGRAEVIPAEQFLRFADFQPPTTSYQLPSAKSQIPASGRRAPGAHGAAEKHWSARAASRDKYA